MRVVIHFIGYFNPEFVLYLEIIRLHNQLYSLKFSIAYYLVLLYLTVLAKPLVPLISDAWSHEFNETEHISLVHAVYGSHHLEKELADTTKDNDHGKSQNTVKFDDLTSFHIPQDIVNYNFSLNKKQVDYLLFDKNKLPFVLISNQGPPPKFS